ncbi:hypothetical protein Tco_1474715 [Tanacetum coccineum]
MEDANPIRTLRDYSRPSHEGYKNTIKLSEGNNVVPLRSDTIQLVQNGCSFHELRSEDPNQHLNDFLKLLDSLDLDVANRERTGSHDTQYCMENPEQAFVDYASSHTDEAGGLVSNFMASQDANLSKFEADFKQQQSEITNKIDTVLKAITDRVTGALPSDTVKNLKLNFNSTSPVFSARSYPTEDQQCSTRIHNSINAITICPKRPDKFQNGKPEEEEQEEKDNPENINTNSSLPPDPSVSFITEKVCKLNSFFESLGLVP